MAVSFLSNKAANLPQILFLFALLSATISFSSADLGLLKEARLNFYFREVFAGPNGTTTTAASLNNPSSNFGDVYVIDDEIREGPEPTSKLIGHVQGMTVQASAKGPIALLFTTNFVFSEGEYNGSTLAVFGRATLSATRDYTVIGGSGKFRLARGYAHGDFVDSPAGTMVIKFSVRVLHY